MKTRGDVMLYMLIGLAVFAILGVLYQESQRTEPPMDPRVLAKLEGMKVQLEGLESHTNLNLGLEQKINDTYKKAESLELKMSSMENDFNAEIERVQDHLAEVRKMQLHPRPITIRTDQPLKIEQVPPLAKVPISTEQLKKVAKQIKGLSK